MKEEIGKSKKTDLVPKQENQLVKQEAVAGSPMAMIELALKQNADLDKLHSLLDLKMRYEKNEAEKAYTVAMAKFKENPPVVTKDKTNSQYKSKYTSLNNLVNTVSPKLSEQGLSASWDIEQNGTIKVTCKLTHKQGHSGTATMSAQADGSGSKNAIQQIKSTITYLKAVTFESILGLASSDANVDDDGKASDVEYITGDDLQDIRAKSMKYKVDEAIFLKYIGAESFDKINVKDYGKTIMALEEKRKQNESKGAK